MSYITVRRKIILHTEKSTSYSKIFPQFFCLLSYQVYLDIFGNNIPIDLENNSVHFPDNIEYLFLANFL